jgi:hypothetical protein
MAGVKVRLEIQPGKITLVPQDDPPAKANEWDGAE